MFALLYDETLYLKVDDEHLADFISRGLPQFEYQRQGKLVGLSYYRAPESVLEDRAQAAAWARRAWEAALRANADKPVKKRTPLPHRRRREAAFPGGIAPHGWCTPGYQSFGRGSAILYAPPHNGHPAWRSGWTQSNT